MGIAMKNIALDLWLSLKTGAICALEFWRAARGESNSEPVTVEYRGFIEQPDGSWVWRDGGIEASISEYDTGRWAGSAAKPGENPYVYVDFQDVESIVDCMRHVVYGTDDGEPPKN